MYYKQTVIRMCANGEIKVHISVHEFEFGQSISGGFQATINQWNREAALQVKNGVKVGQNIYMYCIITRDEYLNHK